MSTTGNLYLQVFNKQSGAFYEVPENRYSIGLFIENTGTKSLLRSPNFSGFVFSNPIKVPSLEMMPINIGARNVTGSGNYAINIGIFNANRFTHPGFITSGFLGGANVGYYNAGKDATYLFNFGATNSSTDSHAVTNLGLNNSTRATEFLSNIGFFNNITTGYNILIFGYDNNLFSGRDITLLGSENYNLNLRYSNILGRLNTVKNSYGIDTIGNSNYIDNTKDSQNLGNENSLRNSKNITVINKTNSISGSSSQMVIGANNKIINSTGNSAFGDQNSLEINSSSNIFGSRNILRNNSASIIYGNSNNNLNDFNSKIYGSNNSLSGTRYAFIIGNNNSLDRSIINELYRIELTGITGSGPTLFTGVTGYKMLGGYNGIDGNGGQNNFIVGDGNSTSLNSLSYAFGKDNILLSNAGSFAVGQGNYLESSQASYAFGQNNSISGYKNYVFGNNNTVRSGDYNSILIGMSHEFTGEYKVASVNIASLDSRIEVNPSQVKINSPTRAKLNNENIVISSDLNSYLKSSNALSNSGVFSSYVINDPSYSNLSSQIELQSFVYSGTEDRYYGGFSGKRLNNPSAYNFSGFFRKQEAVYYTGSHSIYGNYYYLSDNNNFEMLFSRDIEPITGNWIISPVANIGCLFFNKSTNTGIVPISNWRITGSSTYYITGNTPAPSFTYSSSFTGFFPAQKIDSSSSYLHNHFNNFGTVAYPSNTHDIAVIYGNHIIPKFDPTWLIVDKYSSGLYYINNTIGPEVTPQTGWVATGYMGFTGGFNYLNEEYDLVAAEPVINNTGIKISLGQRSGLVSSYDPVYGKIYIPFFY